MADTAKQLYHDQPGTSIGDLYGPAPAGKTFIRGINFVNTSGADATITLSIGTTGIDTAASRFVAAALTIPAHASDDWSGFQVLEADQYITGKQGSSGAITVTISGVEQ